LLQHKETLNLSAGKDLAVIKGGSGEVLVSKEIEQESIIVLPEEGNGERIEPEEREMIELLNITEGDTTMKK
jgi:predicted PhzF superfamily epimerase YddE/YHI9